MVNANEWETANKINSELIEVSEKYAQIHGVCVSISVCVCVCICRYAKSQKQQQQRQQQLTTATTTTTRLLTLCTRASYSGCDYD